MKIVRLKDTKNYDVTYWHKTPAGIIKITVDSTHKYITSINFSSSFHNIKNNEPPIVTLLKKELDEYFMNKRKVFTVSVGLYGTDFQFKVWNETSKICFGEVKTYGEISKKVSEYSGSISRAVGASENKNPVSIIIPCHRVIGANYRLTGYGGGIEKKEYLLRHEGFNIIDSKIVKDI